MRPPSCGEGFAENGPRAAAWVKQELGPVTSQAHHGARNCRSQRTFPLNQAALVLAHLHVRKPKTCYEPAGEVLADPHFDLRGVADAPFRSIPLDRVR